MTLHSLHNCHTLNLSFEAIIAKKKTVLDKPLKNVTSQNSNVSKNVTFNGFVMFFSSQSTYADLNKHLLHNWQNKLQSARHDSRKKLKGKNKN